MKIVFSAHARERMEERKVTDQEIELTLEKPEKEGKEEDTLIAMKIRSNGHLLIVIYREIGEDTKYVITIVDTSKVKKYL